MRGKRSTFRTTVFRSLYEADFRNITDPDAVVSVFDRIADDEGIQCSKEEKRYVQETIHGVLAHQKDIDKMLAAVATDWPIEKMAIVDRNVLRLGLFEILFGEPFNVPPKVAISEAIETVKLYGGEASGAFVNGVLGTILKEVKTPDEIESTSSARKMVGSLVFAVRDDVPCFVFIKDMKNKWTVPKGRIQEQETLQDAVSRVTREEVGLTVKALHQIGRDMYINHSPDGVVRKDVTYLLSEGQYAPLNLKACEGLKDVGWFTAEEAAALPMYKNVITILRDAVQSVVSMLEQKDTKNWKRYVDDLHKSDTFGSSRSI